MILSYFFHTLLVHFYFLPKFVAQTHTEYRPIAPFGTLLGTSHGVEVYSSDYDSITGQPGPWEDPTWYSNRYNGTYTGFKWQCVELGRRFLLINFGVVYDSIPMAYDIFRLHSVIRVSDNHRFRMYAHKNGSETLPKLGSLLIWAPKGEFTRTGHIAVIVNVTLDHVDIIEQNVDDAVWPEGQQYSRRLSAKTENGKYYIGCTFPDTELLGWMNIALDEPYDYDEHPNCNVSSIGRYQHRLTPELANKPWLNLSIPYLEVFAKAYGEELGSADTPSTYYTIPQSFDHTLEFATNELHKLFLDATDYVLHHQPEVGKYFSIPNKLWPKIRRSWFSRRSDVVSGRFDFTVTSDSLKVYEYNADSASCLLEAGYIQEHWSQSAGLSVGKSDSSGLFPSLVQTWKAKKLEGPLHLLCDNDKEEIYHTLYMKSAAEEAGIKCYMMIGSNSVSWKDGNLIDENGVVIQNVWKTWSWRTALNQLSEDDPLLFLEKKEDFDAIAKSKTGKATLVDILLNVNIRIFEPLWTIIPSSKAILPILWKLKPKHPYLLDSSFELTEEYKKNGYVIKPVTGRAGGNISLFDSEGRLIEKTEGKWESDVDVFQELAMLPKFDGDYVQFCTWAIGGQFAGTVLRVDKSGIINLTSSVSPLRVVDDV